MRHVLSATFLLIDHVEEVLPDLLFTDLIGSPPVVLGQVFDGFHDRTAESWGPNPGVAGLRAYGV